jgi:hypothetical protein
MFLVRDLTKISRRPDAGEDIEIVKMPFEEALESVLRGEITHGASCVLILKTHMFLSRRRR